MFTGNFTAMNGMEKFIPMIASEWRVLFQPQVYGRYVNDHSLVRYSDGSWHLFGITSHAKEGDDYAELERYFVHAAGSLWGAEPMREVGKCCDNGVRAWAPGVIRHGPRYFMYYGPSPMRMATSFELCHWMEQTPTIGGAPLDSCHRDSMVFKVAEDRWLMYITGIDDSMFGVVSVLESHNLVDWKFLRFALRTSGKAPYNPPWGATESPFVVKRGELYYLFITYTDCKHHNYHNTLVFTSTDPTDFGNYTGDNEADVVVAKLHAHAPEIIQDSDGQWYITTCGWRGYNTPVEGGVAIAKLEWKADS
jgi:beta-fructofuranosidase